MADRKTTIQQMLIKLNQKSKKNWTLQDVLRISSGININDFKDKKRAPLAIQKVARAAGANISPGKAKQIAQLVQNQLKK